MRDAWGSKGNIVYKKIMIKINTILIRNSGNQDNGMISIKSPNKQRTEPVNLGFYIH